jgi:hypothetical protein
MLFGFANLVFAGVFLYATYVQYNDPDAGRWFAIYGAASLLTLVDLLRRPPRWAPGLVATVAFVWALILLPQVLRERAFTGTEVEREAAGLLLVAIWMSILFWRERRLT